MFLLLSLIAGALVEVVAAAFGVRATVLENWIFDLIKKPQGDIGRNSVLSNVPKVFYRHPQIDNLVKGLAKGRPSYIPSDVFSRALIDSIISASHAWQQRQPAPQQAAQQQQAGQQQQPVQAQQQAGQQQPQEPPRTFDVRNVSLAANAPLLLKDLRDALKRLPPGDPMLSLMAPFLFDANGNIGTLRKSVEDWFNNAMQRLSGWYKRWAYWYLCVFGTIITVVLAIDTIEVTKYLTTNKSAREMLVQNASQFLQANPAAPSTGGDAAAKLPIQCPPRGTDHSTPPSGPDLTKCYQYLQNTLANQGYPIGWGQLVQRWCDATKGGSWWEGIKFIVQTAFGWLFTILAITMGSNFWFDSLRNLLNLRAVGGRPQQTNGKKNGQPAQGQPAQA
jgi:hypothetical protein